MSYNAVVIIVFSV